MKRSIGSLPLCALPAEPSRAPLTPSQRARTRPGAAHPTRRQLVGSGDPDGLGGTSERWLTSRK